MRIRMKFRKNGAMRFVGHLDLMRYFQKAMRRAGLDLSYSEGFHPHPILSFAAPLGLGLTSDGEYLDVELLTSLSAGDAMKAMNDEMAEGMEVTDYVFLPENAPNAMSVVAAADYFVYFRHKETFTQKEIADGIRAYYKNRDAIPVTKQSKNSEREIDLKPLLYLLLPCEDAMGVAAASIVPPCEPEYRLSDLGTRRGFFLRLSTGSTENIKPNLVLEDFYHFLGEEYHSDNLQIHRLDLYTNREGTFQPLNYV